MISIIILLVSFNRCTSQNTDDFFEAEKTNFTKKIMQVNWDEPDKIKELIIPSIIFKKSSNTSFGSSKLGGLPDLPPNISWPKFEGKSMVFFAQINLSELAKFHHDTLFPKTGILYFFSYFQNPENEFGAEYEFIKDQSEYTVLYTESKLSELRKTEFPTDLISDYHFEEQPIKFELKYQIPSTRETWLCEKVSLTPEDQKRYDNLIFNQMPCYEEIILGSPCPMQYGVDYDWAYSYTNITDFKDSTQIAKVNAIRPEFINLLSFSMYNLFESIGYSNCYYGITKKDLGERAFDKVVFIMQGT